MAAEDVELGAAERGVGDFDDDIGWVADSGDGAVLQGDLVGAVEDDGFHC